jgi:hypothetical protein
MSSKNKTDTEMGVQKFTIRIPTAIEQTIKELAQDETRAKNNMYVVLLKEALAMRGVHFDEQNERTESPVVIPTKVVLPMEKSGPLFWGDQMAYLDVVHLELPDEEGIQCTISFKDANGVQRSRLVPLLELEPYWYYVRRTGTAPKYDWNVSPVPKELL